MMMHEPCPPGTRVIVSSTFDRPGPNRVAHIDRLLTVYNLEHYNGIVVAVVPWSEISEGARNGTNAVLEGLSIGRSRHFDVHHAAKTYVIYAHTSVLNRNSPIVKEFNDFIFIPDDQRFAVVRELL